jgi:hypothetical protein
MALKFAMAHGETKTHYVPHHPVSVPFTACGRILKDEDYATEQNPANRYGLGQLTMTGTNICKQCAAMREKHKHEVLSFIYRDGSYY